MAIRRPSNPSARGHPGGLSTKKLVAAGKDLAEIGKIWNQYRAEVHLSQQIELDHRAHTITYIAHIDRLPDSEDLERMRGYVASTRSALDNLVYALGKSMRCRRRPYGATASPIVTVPGKWKRAERNLTELPPQVVQRVRAVQSLVQYMSPAPPHPLELMRDLSNADKHRDSFSIRLVPLTQPGSHALATTKITVPWR